MTGRITPFETMVWLIVTTLLLIVWHVASDRHVDRLEHRLVYLECVERQGGTGQQSSIPAVRINDGRLSGNRARAVVTGCKP